MKKIILIDMDNTMVDFDSEYISRMEKKGIKNIKKTIIHREKFEIEDNLSDSLRSDSNSVIGERGFFADLKPFHGSIQVINELMEEFNVYFCTSPHKLNIKSCIFEKLSWIAENFGDDAMKKVIITFDKTIIDADWLIDDKPIISGANINPSWEHIVFNQPYNLNTSGPRVMNWFDIKDFFKGVN
ncbi:MAG: 5'-nucleotidase [Bacteriovoracaceae bacterium]|jgi:5'-nucleotidase